MNQHDFLRRFIFENLNIRGEWVCLKRSWQQAKQHQVLVNPQVESQLGQALAAVVLLSATIKFKGSMIMQIQGDGALKAVVAQATDEREIRGLVRSDSVVAGDTLKAMMGDGRLVLTIYSEHAEPYQGIVPLEESNLADVLKTYFEQSEQLPTRLWLFANSDYAAGLFLQEMPGADTDETDWERLLALAHTLTSAEMFTLDSETLLHRLFHEEQLRLYDLEAVTFRCNCSREKIGNETLVGLGRDFLNGILNERPSVDVDCQFCGQHYSFDKAAVEALFLAQPDASNAFSSLH